MPLPGGSAPWLTRRWMQLLFVRAPLTKESKSLAPSSLTLTQGAHQPAPAAPGPAHSSARRLPYLDGPRYCQLPGKMLVRGKRAVHFSLS